MNDIVFKLCSDMMTASPARSYKRLNPALHSLLANCIDADLPFQETTFRDIYSKLRGSFWFGAAFLERKTRSDESASIERWRSGVNGTWLDVTTIALRVRDGMVECTNGNAVSVAAAKRVLPVIMAHRSSRNTEIGASVDSYTVRSASSKGVQVGCTLVPWKEIDLINSQLAVICS